MAWSTSLPTVGIAYLAVALVGLAGLAHTFFSPLPVPVLLIHDVAEKRLPWDFWTITPAKLEEVVGVVSRLGFSTLRSDQVTAHLAGQLPAREARHGLVFTVDDGPASSGSLVGPLLARRGLTGVFFVVSGRGPPRSLSGDQVRALVAAGHEIGSHSVNHVSLTTTAWDRTTEDRFRQELAVSRQALATWSGRDVVAVAYPKGEFDATTKRLARETGYRLAFTTDPGYLEPGGDPLEIPRFQLNWDTPASAVEEFLVGPGKLRQVRLLSWTLLTLVSTIALAMAWRSSRHGSPAARAPGAGPPA
ncbi:MAG: polysaccharide deacetylase family protein [Candidatus Riflebacteria bacterium]|nr:polysaccharide deacetylase family protein [Candidatus Riflebacteria bacterium]